ncbi:Mitochondrial distribution and morphology protein 12 [Mortierella alpina]|nr:Mitochondrial distribution and morphology protein 12 [Mortierella alpina]
MSFLDDEVALQIEGMIHAHFQRIPKPAFMGNIAVSKFRFGSTPPSITVLDVTDPLEEWYVHMDQEEARLAQEADEAGGGESLDEDELASDDDEYDDHFPYSADESIVMVGEGDDIEYLDSVAYEEEERDRMGAEDWLRQNNRERSRSAAGSSSGDSYKGGHKRTSEVNSISTQIKAIDPEQDFAFLNCLISIFRKIAWPKASEELIDDDKTHEPEPQVRHRSKPAFIFSYRFSQEQGNV